METAQRHVPTYLALSIFNLLCCCFPLGIVALVFSLRAENASGVGKMEEASKASRTARILNIVGIVLGIIFIIAMIIFVIVTKTAR
ncbi:synapse differentiation-inducing protein 1-like [Alligator mississippiensis]|uniref:Synapse differentiation-inducing protein 1-like n=1 Tax=Alligator mississippiensis TaxID=8496 RepID=A0A151LZS2_ALLMI|nr:synapse differentiation-inducing protein 1-like [Alligator mississippiensis]